MSAVDDVSDDNSQGIIPRLNEQPEIIKIVLIDAAQWEWDWAPEKYDPRLGFDIVTYSEHHFYTEGLRRELRRRRSSSARLSSLAPK